MTPAAASAPFRDRVRALPYLGTGISTEFGAGAAGIDVNAFAESRPDLVRFLEIGADLERGLDADARRWIESGRPATYHFLDVNLEEIEDLDAEWMSGTRSAAGAAHAAWLCGDAGLWHIGRRDPGHGTLMPPILEPESAAAMAAAVRRLRAATGFEVLPENPPAHAYLGSMHLLDYFAAVTDQADAGILLDVAHLAIYQHVMGHDPLDGLGRFPLDRVVEIHVAGGRYFEHAGRDFIDDDHGVHVLDATWTIFEAVVKGAGNLKAVVVECERNTVANVTPLFERVRRTLEEHRP